VSSTFAQVPGRELRSVWWLRSLVGLLSITAGVVILFKPSDSLATIAVVAGVFLVVDGILELSASLIGAAANRGLTALLGVLSLIVGIMLIRHPIRGVVAVALLIGLWLITVGVVRLVATFELTEHRGWNGAVAVIDILAGIVLVSSPDIGMATLALLAGISFIANGVGLTALGWRVRRVTEGQPGPERDAGAPA
jgi:uncharacterized membrane protein HdeD (DUF308 family)